MGQHGRMAKIIDLSLSPHLTTTYYLVALKMPHNLSELILSPVKYIVGST